MEKLSKLTKQELIERLLRAEKQLSDTASIKTKRQYKHRAFDFDKHVQRRVALKISYLGWDLDGFASQDNTNRTVEFHLFKALETAKLIKDRKSSDYNRCGRTDKGVSAHCQVVALNVRSKLPPSHPSAILPPDFTIPDEDSHIEWSEDNEIPYSLALNQLLPPEIRILGWSAVSKDFSARYDCVYREYKYLFLKGTYDIPSMEKAASYLVGKHNFRNLCRIDKSKGGIQSFDRTIERVMVVKHSHLDESDPKCMYALTIRGNAFLLHQVRCIMSVLFSVASGNETPEIVRDLLNVDRYPEPPQYKLASPIPLVLWDCGYKPNQVNFKYIPYNMSKIEAIMQELSSEFLVKSAILTGLSDDILFSNNVEHEGENIQWGILRNTWSLPKKEYIPILQRKINHKESVEERLLRYEEKRQKKYGKIKLDNDE